MKPTSFAGMRRSIAVPLPGDWRPMIDPLLRNLAFGLRRYDNLRTSAGFQPPRWRHAEELRGEQARRPPALARSATLATNTGSQKGKRTRLLEDDHRAARAGQ